MQTIDPNLTNDFRFRQRISATYVSYQATRRFQDPLGGLRAEEVHTDAALLTNETSTSGSYFRVYPSLHWIAVCPTSRRLCHSARAALSRPDPSNLNPYIDYEYAPNLQTGNPNLRPQFTQSFEVGYGYEGRGSSYGVTGYYRLNQDSVTAGTEYLGNGLSLTTKTNLPKHDSTGLELSANGHIVRALSYGISGNLFYNQIDATALGIAGLQSTVGLNAKVKLDYRPTADDSAQITATRTDKRSRRRDM